MKLFYIIGVAGLILLSSCATLPGDPSPPTRFYLLSSLVADGSGKGLSGNQVVEIAAVEIAPYLHRPQIVFRQADHRLHLADYDQWGEELSDGIGRVLEENLSGLLGEWVRRAATHSSLKEAKHLYFRINRFERDEQGRVVLSVYWTLHGTDGTEILAKRWSRGSEEKIGDDDYSSMVTAMNHLLKQFSQDVAGFMR